MTTLILSSILDKNGLSEENYNFPVVVFYILSCSIPSAVFMYTRVRRSYASIARVP